MLIVIEMMSIADSVAITFEQLPRFLLITARLTGAVLSIFFMARLDLLSIILLRYPLSWSVGLVDEADCFEL